MTFEKRKEALQRAKEVVKKAKKMKELVDAEILIKRAGGEDIEFQRSKSEIINIRKYKEKLMEEIERTEERLRMQKEIIKMIMRHKELYGGEKNGDKT